MAEQKSQGQGAAAAAAANLPGNGTTSQDDHAGPKALETGGVLTIKLH